MTVVRFDPPGPLRGALRPPPDKSISHRAALIAAMSEGTTRISGYLDSADTQSTLAAVAAVGATVREGERERKEHGGLEIAIDGVGLRGARSAEIDVGNAGTLLRIMPGWLAGQPEGAWTLDGDESIRRRPVDRVAEPLRMMGAAVECRDGRLPPLRVAGRRLTRILPAYRLPVASAQVKSCLLFAGLLADAEMVIAEPLPSRDHSERMLRAAGAQIEGATGPEGGGLLIRPADRLELGECVVPGDVSSAAPWLVAAALHPDADLTVPEAGLNPTRTALVELLREAGADVTATVTDDDGPEPIGQLRVRGANRLAPIEVTGSRTAELIDELPLVGVLMAMAGGELRDASELRLKESDRIATTVAGLADIGASVEELADGWRVAPGAPREAEVTTHGDHRIAIAFAVAALAGIATAVQLDDPECVVVSYPTFWSDMAQVTA
jgi:3-phosphoshikimate 1-carboxyvinyltransferase